MAEDSATQVKPEEAVSELYDNMQEIPKSMRAFSLGMRALYAEGEVSSREESGRKFNQLRDDTKRDALVYINGVLPVSTTLVRSIKEFFEYYQELSMDEWKENLSEIIEEVKGYRQCCEEVVRLHEDILTSLKKRQDQAKILVNELGQLKAEYERKKRELEAKASSRRAWGYGLFLIPVVNFIATPLLMQGADRATAEAVANGFQAKVSHGAALLVSDAMIPALQSFITGVEGIAGFFAVIEQEITTF
ncbi:hypothetical protein HOLleu_11964 [Holothuria leucospilota]|uniref:Uncharacterized protein n=1 Tax=Holothuria leucospilota TaxID=206669 RepID=A0A9Q1H9T2_HOLLE|nr:hypothetical protein HOLleu_11964 [Holothuria leucospilota]